MRKAVILTAVACLLALGGQSFAELCTIDAVPAATLLLPYFEVSLNSIDDDPVQADRNVDTFFSVSNASAAPTVAHVVLWGDWSLPSIDFDIFLTGYDVETVSLSDVFNNGNLPITSHGWNDVNDDISPHGQNAAGAPHGPNPAWDSQPDNPANPRFPGCDQNLPLGPNPTLQGSFLDRIRCGHTGRGLSCQNASCIGQVHDETGGGANDWIARGYITIDNVLDCNLRFPNDPTGYFGTAGVASNVNQLWGDWFIVQDGRAFGDNLVAIEAADDIQYPMQQFVAGDYTYYGRYVAGLATDQREPLASIWATRYFNTAGDPGALRRRHLPVRLERLEVPVERRLLRPAAPGLGRRLQPRLLHASVVAARRDPGGRVRPPGGRHGDLHRLLRSGRRRFASESDRGVLVLLPARDRSLQSRRG